MGDVAAPAGNTVDAVHGRDEPLDIIQVSGTVYM